MCDADLCAQTRAASLAAEQAKNATEEAQRKAAQQAEEQVKNLALEKEEQVKKVAAEAAQKKAASKTKEQAQAAQDLPPSAERRWMSAEAEPLRDLPPILGLFRSRALPLREAASVFADRIPDLANAVEVALYTMQKRVGMGTCFSIISLCFYRFLFYYFSLLPPPPLRHSHALRLQEEPDPHGVTVEEAAAIYIYTLEFQGGPSVYTILNRVLRLADRTEALPYFPVLRILLAGLHKLPKRQVFVQRGVPQDLSKDYRPGKEVWIFNRNLRLPW